MRLHSVGGARSRMRMSTIRKKWVGVGGGLCWMYTIGQRGVVRVWGMEIFENVLEIFQNGGFVSDVWKYYG